MPQFAAALEQLRLQRFSAPACEAFLAESPWPELLRLMDEDTLDSAERGALLEIVEGLLLNEQVFAAVFLVEDNTQAKALLGCGEEAVMGTLARALGRHTPLLARTLEEALQKNPPMAEELLSGLFFLACDELPDCSVAVLHFFCHLCVDSTVIESPAFMQKLREMLCNPNVVVQIRAMEVLLNTAAVSPYIAHLYGEKRLYTLCLAIYRQCAGDMLARLNVLEVMKVGCIVKPFLAVLEDEDLQSELMGELKNPATELYLRRDLVVLCIALHKAREGSSVKELAPFLEMATTFLKAEGEEFTAGVELLLHLLQFVEVLHEVSLSSEPKQLLLLDRKRDYEQAKLRELKVDVLVDEKWSLATGHRAELSQQLFETYFRLFYGHGDLGTDRCADALFENIRTGVDNAEALNLRVLLKLLDYPALLTHVLHMQKAVELVAYLTGRDARSNEVLDLRAEVRDKILERIDELKEKDENVKRLLTELKRKPADAGVDTAAQ